MTTEGARVDRAALEGVRELIEEAIALSADYGPMVEEIVREAANYRLDDESARSLFTRILTILRTEGQPENADADLAERVRAEVEGLIEDPARLGAAVVSASGEAGPVEFVERNGLTPHRVVPTPTFNGVPVEMEEGYVDVTQLQLWPENHRVQLHVDEFRAVHQREPEPHELLLLVQGQLGLPSLASKDPFEIQPLAKSIARKGVERPPIITHDGLPKDGNRRLAASMLVLSSGEFTPEEKERARWLKLWRAAKETTDDQFEAIVVANNFEDDHKMRWDEYIKARLVMERYHLYRGAEHGRFTPTVDKRIKQQVARDFAIAPTDVTRYQRMVQWAEDFEQYHVDERGREAAAVHYKANAIFQWFYEIQAGRGASKLTQKLDQDDAMKRVVYDLMYDVLDSGAQVRSLHKVVADESALKLLEQAHDQADSDIDEAKKLIDAAIAEAQKNSPTRRIGFAAFLRTLVSRLEGARPDMWSDISTDQLTEVRTALHHGVGAIEGELASREPIEKGADRH